MLQNVYFVMCIANNFPVFHLFFDHIYDIFCDEELFYFIVICTDLFLKTSEFCEVPSKVFFYFKIIKGFFHVS